ncbi:MAG: amidophosphoribosyltransferase [Opitutales bacterium]
MSDTIHHECGIALVRLRKPLSYYQERYGTPLYGFNKLFLLMEKQHNRGQDGAGIGCAKLGMPAGRSYLFRERSVAPNALSAVFNSQLQIYEQMVSTGEIHPEFAQTVKERFDFGGEVLLGHLRYGTSGSYGTMACHPYLRRSNWPTQNLLLAGNFNMTNTDALNQRMIDRGQHPIFEADTQTILEEVGFVLDQEHHRLYQEIKGGVGPLAGDEIQAEISRRLDPGAVIRQASEAWDGGYAIGGVIGNGDAFVFRDPHGIRPAFYFADDEVVAFASERVALMTIFNQSAEAVRELDPGAIGVIRRDGSFTIDRFKPEAERHCCSFERIYFSRGNDPEIHAERKALGAALAPQVLWSIDHDLRNAVFSYIPNTAETAYFGLLDSLRRYRRDYVKKAILEAQTAGNLNEATLDNLILENWPRGEKIANKDIKLRTFISQESGRAQLVSHVYDITYGVVKDRDSLVVIDDSIVRGTTLKESILRILSRTGPRKIVIASTAPQIRYPDCYGIDMSELGKFIAFQAAIALHREHGSESVVLETYQACLEELNRPVSEQRNPVKDIYSPFTENQISRKIAALVRPADLAWQGELEILYQTVDALHQACPNHNGDWYFTGDYPTAGGTAVCNRAFVNFYESRSGRAY